MIIFLYGEDSYRSRQKLDEIIQEYKKTNKSGLNLRFFDYGEPGVSVDDLKNSTQQFSMFRDKNLTVVKNLFSDVNNKEKFLKIAKDLSDGEDIIIIYEDNKPKESDALLKFLKKNTKFQEFGELKLGQKREWVKKEFDSVNARIDGMTLDYFLGCAGNDLWAVSNEINKVTNYKKGKEIKIEDIKLLIKPKIETDIFRTVDAIGQKNKKQALGLIYKHLENGDSPLYLLSMISYQFRNLLIVKELIEKAVPYNLLVKKSGLHPFVVRKSCDQAQLFSFGDLKKIYQRIFEVDLNIKIGKIEPELALDLLVASL